MAARSVSRALVTGASTGIGRVFAKRLAERGADLVVVARDEQRLQDLADEVRAAHGRQVEVLRADLSDREQLAAVERRVAGDPPIDLLVNNAGYGDTTYFADADRESPQGQIDVNITALTRLSHAAAGAMKGRGGGIINVASGAAFLPTPAIATYCATKAYVVSLSEALHEELAPHDVTVTVVCPGFTRTEFQQRANYDTSNVPDFAWQSAEDVVDATLAGYEAGNAFVVPGTLNRATLAALNLVPRSLLPKLAARLR